MKNIYLIVGASGSGKTTIANKLEELCGYKQVNSYTTRAARSPNEAGHIFTTIDKRPCEDDIVAATYYNGNHYWTTRQQIEECDIFVVDTKGIEMMCQKYHGTKQIKVIEIDVSQEERYNRMIARGDKPSQALERIVFDMKAFATINSDKVIQNKNLDLAVEDVLRYIIKCEKSEEI